MLDIVPYFVVFSTLLYLAQLGFAVQKQEASISLIYSSLEFFLYMALIPLKKRFKTKISHYMVFLNFLTMLGTYLQVIVEDRKRNEDLKNGVVRENLDIRAKYEYFIRTTLTFIAFACPSTMIFFYYIGMFILFVTILSIHKGELQDDEFIEALA